MAQPSTTYTKKNETGCCPVPNVKEWDEKEVTWKDKKFIKDTTINFMHVPMNMGQVMKRMWEKIKAVKAEPKTEEWMILSCDVSAWKGEHLASVTKEVPGAENVTLSGRFMTKVFEGPYKEAGKWVKQMEEYVEDKNEKMSHTP